MNDQQSDFIKNTAISFVKLEKIFVPFHCTKEQFSKAVTCFYDSIREDITIEKIKNL